MLTFLLHFVIYPYRMLTDVLWKVWCHSREVDSPKCPGGLELCGDGVGQGPHSEVLPPLQAVPDREEEMEVDIKTYPEDIEMEEEETGEEEMEVDIKTYPEDIEMEEEETGEEEMEVDIKTYAEDIEMEEEETGEEEMEVGVDVEEEMEVDVDLEEEMEVDADEEEEMEVEMEEYIEAMDIDEKDEEEALILA
ncbi:unnamed protein product [Coccothraustes coccothraustes]